MSGILLIVLLVANFKGWAVIAGTDGVKATVCSGDSPVGYIVESPTGLPQFSQTPEPSEGSGRCACYPDPTEHWFPSCSEAFDAKIKIEYKSNMPLRCHTNPDCTSSEETKPKNVAQKLVCLNTTPFGWLTDKGGFIALPGNDPEGEECTCSDSGGEGEVKMTCKTYPKNIEAKKDSVTCAIKGQGCSPQISN